VTEQQFGEHIDELRRKVTETNHQTTPITKTAHANPQDRPVARQVSHINNNDVHETAQERDGNSGQHRTDVFAEFVNGWRNLMSNNDALSRRPRRKLDVLSWGFGE
jgi:hypothetical protein